METLRWLSKEQVEVAKGVIEALAYVLAGGFFLYKWISGYQTTNLSLEIVPTRQPDPKSAKDLLKVVLVLTKGDRGSVHIFNIGVTVNNEHFDLMSGLEHYFVKKPNARDRTVNWDAKDLKYVNFLNPGERTEVAIVCGIDKNEIGHIEIVVVGRRKWSRRLKQWRAAAASLPLPPP
jgi:hypothetical protein